jgi:hypothetical protein
MKLSSIPLSRGASGPDVVEIQIRLAGFRGTLWDGRFGPGTELQVIAFQRDYLGNANPNAIVDRATWDGLEKFAAEFPIDFQMLKCPCGRCPGFGNGSNEGVYYPGKAKIEMNYRYEYPGVHKAILNTYRAAQFYGLKAGYGQAVVNSGYRCTINNEQNHRETTNHMGKALDIDFPLRPGEGKREDCERCDSVRGILVEKANCQIGWGAANRKSLEPSDIAPSWVHMDVRSYEMQYLDKSFFVNTAADLDKFD